MADMQLSGGMAASRQRSFGRGESVSATECGHYSVNWIRKTPPSGRFRPFRAHAQKPPKINVCIQCCVENSQGYRFVAKVLPSRAP